MQNDINTQGHTQWFFFKISNTFSSHTVKFNIMNYVILKSQNQIRYIIME